MFEKRPLESLIERQQGGGTPERNNPRFWNGPIPWASVKDFRDNQLALNSTEESITQQGLAASSTNLIPAGTPLVCTRMAVGRCAISNSDLTINQDVKALFPKANVSPRYLLRLLDSLKFHAENVSVGSTVKGIRISDLLGIQTPIAPLHEQTKIAQILDTLDTQIQKTEALIAKLEKIKEGLLHDLLTRGIDRNGQLRPTPDQAPELYKESALGLIPDEWSISRIEEVSTKVTNGFVGVATPHYTQDGSGVLYLFGNNIRPNYVDLKKCERVNQRFHKAQLKSQLKDGDMLTVQSGHIGTCAVYEESMGEANCHALIITRFKSENIRSKFIALYCNSKIGMQAQGRLFIGSTILHINTSDLAKLPIPVPSLR